MIPEYLLDAANYIEHINVEQVSATVRELLAVRNNNGRVFCVGNGGGQAHASHMAADLRKLGRIEAYAWGDNAPDLTAWVNDDTWADAINNWLDASHPTPHDAVFVFSVGGGSAHTSRNLTKAMWRHDTRLLGIVGANGGELAGNATVTIVLPCDATPHVEGLQSVIAHCIITCLQS